MSDYTPTTEEVREDYALGLNEGVGAGWYDEHRVEFDRWLAAHDAEKRAEWEAEQRERIASEIEAEGADTSDGLYYDAYINGLRRAIEIVRDGR